MLSYRTYVPSIGSPDKQNLHKEVKVLDKSSCISKTKDQPAASARAGAGKTAPSVRKSSRLKNGMNRRRKSLVCAVPWIFSAKTECRQKIRGSPNVSKDKLFPYINNLFYFLATLYFLTLLNNLENEVTDLENKVHFIF